jgi:hypothetical protein
LMLTGLGAGFPAPFAGVFGAGFVAAAFFAGVASDAFFAGGFAAGFAAGFAGAFAASGTAGFVTGALFFAVIVCPPSLRSLRQRP